MALSVVSWMFIKKIQHLPFSSPRSDLIRYTTVMEFKVSTTLNPSILILMHCSYVQIEFSENNPLFDNYKVENKL